MMQILSQFQFIKKMFDIKVLFLSFICFLAFSSLVQNNSMAQLSLTIDEQDVRKAEKNSDPEKINNAENVSSNPKDLSGDPLQKDELNNADQPAPALDTGEINEDGNTLSALPQSSSQAQSNYPAQIGTVIDIKKISNDVDFGADPFVGQLSTSALFSSSVSAGDIDIDGNIDLFVGAFGTKNLAGTSTGAAWILFLNEDGTVRNDFKKISDDEDFPGDPFVGQLGDGSEFGHGGTIVGDIDGDGILDLAVGAPGDLDLNAPGPEGEGAVWILFLNAAGEVKANPAPLKIADGLNGFGTVTSNLTEPEDEFGHSVGAIGDLDGDGNFDIIAAAPGDDNDTGSAWVLFLNGPGPNPGTVKSFQKITSADLGGGLLQDDRFGGAGGSSIGDLDGDGVQDTAIGAPAIFNNPGRFGAVWVLFLNTNGTVKGSQKISDNEGGFPIGLIDAGGAFGHGVSGALGDLDGDGITEIAAGDFLGLDDVSSPTGAAWILFMNTDGTVKSQQKISNNVGGFTGDPLDGNDWFGFNVAAIGDINGDNVPDFTSGALRDDGDDMGTVDDDFGAVYILSLSGFAMVNQFLSGDADPTSFVFDPTPVPEGPAGTFSFSADFTNTSAGTTLVELKSITAILTNGNALINRDVGTPPGVGSELTFPATGGNIDLKLEPGESVRVDYVIGLAQRAPFQFFVDAFGVVE